MLMRINTLSKKILYSILFFALATMTYGQCPTATSPQTFCDIQFAPSSPTVANLVATDTGGGVVWYDSATSTTPLPSGFVLVSGASYFVDNTAGTCGTRPSVLVTIYGKPIAQPFQGPCVDAQSDATVADLTATGNNIQWYLSASGGSPLAPTTILIDNAFYYASQTNPITGCETSRRSVQATIGVVPIPAGNPIQFFCNDPNNPPTLDNIIASGNNNWYASATSNIAIPSTTPLASGQSYYATTVDLPCESAARLQVQTFLVEPGNPGVSAVKRICVNDLPTFPSFNLFDELTGNPDATGTWSGPLTTSGGNLGSVNVSTLTLSGSPYTFTYTVSSAPCPNVTSTVTIILLPLPTASISTTNANVCFGRNGFIDFVGTPGATVTYSTGTGPNQVITLNASGNFTLTTPFLTLNTTYTLVSVSSAGVPSCTTPASGSVTFTVVALPTLTVASSPVCSGANATVTATPAAPGNYSYSWTFPAGATDPGNVASFLTTVPGTYSVIMTNLTTTCPSASVSVNVVINPLPTVSVSIVNPTICPGQSAAITAVPGTAGTFNYAWTVPAGVTPPGNVATFSSTIAGNYSVIITNTLTNCVSVSASSILTISPLPTVSVSSPPVCAGNNATVTATPGSAGTYSYVWTVPIGFTNPGNVASFPTSVAGLYSVVMTNTVTNCASASASTTVVINVQPTVTVTSPPVCAGTNATVTAVPSPAGNYTYAWTFPAGATNPGNVASFSTSFVGQYSVVITNTTTTCQSASVSTNVTINPRPTVSVTVVNATICPGQSAVVTAVPGSAGNYSYAWTVPTGATLPGNVATFNATVAGNYSVIITDTVTTCVSDSATGTLTINPVPTVTVSSPPVCAGNSATVTATPNPAGNYNFVWTFPAGATDPGNVASFSTSIPGSYSVIVTNTVTTCPSSSVSTTVVINPIPVVAIVSAPVCSGQNATVTATPSVPGNYNYQWSVPSSATNPGNVATFSTAVAGSYSLIITDSSTNCPSASTAVTVVINPTPTVTVTSSLICSGGTATITATPGSPGTYSYAWTVPSGAADPGNVNTFTTTTPGTYSVQITDTITTCVSTTAGTVTINPPPTVTVNNPSVCPGLDAIITATPGTTGTYSYAWTVPVGANLPGDVATFSTSVLGIYSVVITDLTTTCQSASASGEVIASPAPTVTVNDVSICSGAEATITATPGSGVPSDYTYSWTVPSGAPDPGNTSTFNTTFPGIYGVVITNITSTCASTIDFGTVVISPTPTVSITTPAVCFGDNATITAVPGQAGSYTYSWTVPTGVANPGDVSSFISNVAGTYSVTITDTTTNCVSTIASSVLTVNPLPTATVTSSGTVCSGSSASIVFTGTPNTIVTYNINNGPTSTLNIGASGIFTLNIPLLVTSTFNLVSIILDGPPSCSQLLTGSTTITVTQPPVAGSNAAISLCSNGSTQNLFELLGANAQPGGTWFPLLASGTGVFDPTVDAPGNYVYTVAGAPPCVNDTALVTVTIVPQANAGNDGIANLCSNLDPVDLTTYLGGSPQSGGTWSPVLSSGSNLFDPSTDLAGTYVYTVNGNAPCGNDSASVVVNITQGPSAGVSTSLTVCVNSPSQFLFQLLGPTAQPGGTWLGLNGLPLASGTDEFVPGTDLAQPYIYTISGNQPCDNDTATVTVNVNPVPDAGESATTNICSNSDPVNLLIRLGGNPQDGGVWTPALASGTNFFDPAVDIAQAYTYTVGAPFCDPDSSVLTVVVVQGPDAGISGSVTVCVNGPAIHLFDSLGGSPQPGGTWLGANGLPLASGTDEFVPGTDLAQIYTYILQGNQPCDNDTATVEVTVTPLPNAGTFVGNQDICTSLGTFDLFSLLTGNQLGGLWTDSTNQVVTSTVDVSTLVPNIYSFTYTVSNACGPDDAENVQFTVLPNPTLDGNNIVVSSPNCSGENVVVTFSNVVDGDYILNYDLTLANVLLNQTANVTILNGSGTLEINASLIPVIGTTRVTFLSITNANTSCTTLLTPNISADFIIKASSNLESVNLTAVNVCFGNSVVVQISGATGLTDGTYQFVYTIPNATPTTNTTAQLEIVGGIGEFTVPDNVFSNSDSYTLTINSIVNLSGGCNNLSEDASTNFEIYAIPDLSNAILSADTACINFANDVSITNEVGQTLADGSYVITYELSGAVTATLTDTVTIASNVGVFSIPASNLNVAGSVTVAITQIASAIGACGSATIGVDPITFEVSELETPILLPKGNEFCISDSPTIANLTTNISGTQAVVWYNANSGGTAYADTDLLIDTTTYYGAYISTSGCESATRLPVTVDLTKCEDILIPDGFSPNGDTVNDEFVIKDIEIGYPAFTLEIYNRYGNILYKGNINTPNWNGTTTEGGMKLGNNVVPVGVYFYILNFNDGEREAKQGRLYLSR